MEKKEGYLSPGSQPDGGTLKTLPVFRALPVLLLLLVPAGSADYYGNTPVRDYVTGRFRADRHPLFVEISTLGIPVCRKQYLRREAARSLKRLYTDFRDDHPGVPFWVQSSFRSYRDQRYIWERKWTGKVAVIGRNLTEVPDPLKRARLILRYSSMPGTSRHHWGSDCDLNRLDNSYYDTGAGKVLYEWLRKNAGRYGFCQPYSAGRDSGYSEERWHWSYRPLAEKFRHDWNSLYRKDPSFMTKPGLFPGSSKAGYLAPVYVNSISGSCQ